MATRPDGWLPDLSGRNRVKYLALVEAIADAVAAGDLKPGDRLPAHRDLAWRLGVNTSTITQAYREAARRHLVVGEVGRGTYVLADSAEATLFALKAPEQGEAVDVIDLSTNVPAADPEDTALADSMTALLRTGETAVLAGYHPPALLRRAAAAGSRWLAERGLPARASDVIPCAGAQQGLLAVLLALAGPGETVLVEALTFPGMKALAGSFDSSCTRFPWMMRESRPRGWRRPAG